MFSCDYNGWADVREEEREAIEAFEARAQAAANPPPPPPILVSAGPTAMNLRRKAA